MNQSSELVQGQTNKLPIHEESYLQRVFDLQQEGDLILIWNQYDNLVYVSKQLVDYFLVDKAELLNLRWTDIADKHDVMLIREHFLESNDTCKISNLSFHPITQKNDRFYGFVDKFNMEGVTCYVCELKNESVIDKIKSVMVDFDKLVLTNQLRTSIVHEIRNPLTSLKGFLQLIRSGIAQKEEYYKVINSEIDKLEKITAELLQMGKPHQSVKKIESAKELARAVVLLMQAQTNMKNVEFNLVLDEDAVIVCNATQMKQALLNLIKNGAEAMNYNGRLTVRVKQIDEQVTFDITDEGSGIESSAYGQLNEPYYTTKDSGTGLGLVVTEHIIKEHGGVLKVHSAVNKGTTFSIILPSDMHEG